MPKKVAITGEERQDEELLPFFFPGLNNGTTFLARTQQEAEEKAARLLADS